jgi:hypothetical protein
LLLEGNAGTTSTTYKSGMNRLGGFAVGLGIALSALFPATVHCLLAFSTRLFIDGLAAATIRSYLTAVRSFSVDAGYSLDAFGNARLKRLLRAIERRRPPGKAKKRLPLTTAVLGLIIPFISITSLHGVVLRAILCVGVFGLFRAGELVTKNRFSCILLRKDAKWFPDRVEITLAQSKTDYFREGVTVKVFKVGSLLCPYTALIRAWHAAPLQRPGAPLFQQLSGHPVTYKSFVAGLRSALDAAGLDRKAYAAHSMRIGGASSLAAAGVPAATIKTLGRWRSLCYQRYVRCTDEMLLAAMTVIASPAEAQPGPDAWNGLFGGLPLTAALDLTISNLGLRFNSAHGAHGSVFGSH